MPCREILVDVFISAEHNLPGPNPETHQKKVSLSLSQNKTTELIFGSNTDFEAFKEANTKNMCPSSDNYKSSSKEIHLCLIRTNTFNTKGNFVNIRVKTSFTVNRSYSQIKEERKEMDWKNLNALRGLEWLTKEKC